MTDLTQVFQLRLNAGEIEYRDCGSDSWIPARVVRLRPVSDRNAGVSIMHAHKRHELQLVLPEDLISRENQQIIDDELGSRYYVPRITQIHSMIIRLGNYYFSVSTDYGVRKLVLNTPARNVNWVSASRCIIRDTDGNFFEIPDTTLLDAQSQDFIRHAF